MPKTKTKKPAAKTPRTLPQPRYKHFKLHNRIRAVTTTPLPSSIKLLKASLSLMKKNWRPVLGLVVINNILNLVLVRGIDSNINLAESRELLSKLFVDGGGQLIIAAAQFGDLAARSSQASSGQGTVYQTVIILLTSLATIWLLRQFHSNKKTTVKNSFYLGMYPLIPFVIVLTVICLQLVPLLLGNLVYSIAGQTLAVLPLERLLLAIVFGLMALLSLYMVSSSVFALFIVTLPEMTPLRALRSARQLVEHRRAQVMLKIFVLPIILLILLVLVMFPLILWLPLLAPWVFFIAISLGLVVILAYLYELYRRLL